MQFQKPKGTEDFYPEELSIKKKIFDSFRSSCKKFGYNEVSSPAFENLNLLTQKEGEEITQQIFTLDKRGKEEFGLRFDLTVPITRMFLEKQKSITKPVKWFSIDRMWRYEQPQKGRLREFYQLSVELFGSSSIYADAEIISLAINCLTDLGLTEKDFYLKLNSRKLLQSLLLDFLPEKQLEDAIRIIDKREKISKEEFEKELKENKITKIKEINTLLENKLEDMDCQNEEVKNILKLMDLLGDKRKFVKFDISTARGLAYYTGIVFEVFDTKNKYRAILGGGRYDNLVEMFKGQPTPATGFAIGLSTLSLLLEEKKLLPKAEEGVDYYIAPLGNYKEALKIASKLRKAYSVEIDITGRNLGNQFKYANKINAKKVIIIGEDEIKTKKLTVKDMKTGKETKKTIDEL